VPPLKQGDYAFLLHIVHSLKSTGTAACILPHGVLFRGNAEGAIRRKLIEHRYIKGIIGATAEPVLWHGHPGMHHRHRQKRRQRAPRDFYDRCQCRYRKDGAKNRLRERDIHRIVDTFTRQVDVPGFARMVPLSEIADPEKRLQLEPATLHRQ
jgi:type I restriction enzyme M protein